MIGVAVLVQRSGSRISDLTDLDCGDDPEDFNQTDYDVEDSNSNVVVPEVVVS